MEQKDHDLWYGILTYSFPAVGQAGLGFFRQNGERFVVIFFSREQGAAILERFDSCFGPDEKDSIWVQIDDPMSLPQNSAQDPITIGGLAGTTFCGHFQNYNRITPADEQKLERGYDTIGPRVIAYLYSADFSVGQEDWPKSTIIALKDGKERYHVYIVFSDEEAERVLMLYPETMPDMTHYRGLMEQSPLPPSDRSTIYIGEGESIVAARALCTYVEVPRWLGRLEKPMTPAY